MLLCVFVARLQTSTAQQSNACCAYSLRFNALHADCIRAPYSVCERAGRYSRSEQGASDAQGRFLRVYDANAVISPQLFLRAAMSSDDRRNTRRMWR
jgi:hypothetical protein